MSAFDPNTGELCGKVHLLLYFHQKHYEAQKFWSTQIAWDALASLHWVGTQRKVIFFR